MSGRYFQQVARQPSPGVPVLRPRHQPFRRSSEAVPVAIDDVEPPLPPVAPRAAKALDSPKGVTQRAKQPIQPPVQQPPETPRSPVPIPSVKADVLHPTEVESREPDVRVEERTLPSVVLGSPPEPEPAEIAKQTLRELAPANPDAKSVRASRPQQEAKADKLETNQEVVEKTSPTSALSEDAAKPAVPPTRPEVAASVYPDQAAKPEAIAPIPQGMIRETPPSPPHRQPEAIQPPPADAGVTIGSIVVEILPPPAPPLPPPVRAPAKPANGRLSRDFGVFGLRQG